MMEVRLLEKDSKTGKMSFMLKGADASFANALRRIMMDRVPTMAIEEVEYRSNDSVLYDEMLAHRLGLVPLKADVKAYNLPADCSCKGEGCMKCQAKITLSAKGPGVVYASKMKAKDPSIEPVYPKMILSSLLKDQEIKLEATAVLGLGKEHSKWSPGLVWYKFKPSIDVKSSCDNCGKCVDACPVAIYELKNKKLSVDKDNVMKCHLCDACVEICPKGAITVEGSADDIIFTVESFGSVEPKDIVTQGVKIFGRLLDEFAEKVKKAS
jgi:DNA-directed RNA polymerase subunit D